MTKIGYETATVESLQDQSEDSLEVQLQRTAEPDGFEFDEDHERGGHYLLELQVVSTSGSTIADVGISLVSDEIVEYCRTDDDSRLVLPNPPRSGPD